jgi:hypothetical protein
MVHTAKVKGSEWYVSVAGFRDISVGDVEGFISCVREALPGVRFQVFDADRVAGWRQLF